MSATSVAVLPDLIGTRRVTLTRWLTYASIALSDLFAFASAGVLAVMLRFVFHGRFRPHDWLSFAPSLAAFFVGFTLVGLYPGVAMSPIEEFRRILRASSIVFLVIIGTTFFLRSGILSSRIVFVLAWLLTILLVPLFRRLTRGWCAVRSWWGIPTVILGDREAGVMMINMLEGHPRIGLRPVALLIDDGPSDTSNLGFARPIFIGGFHHAGVLALDYSACYAVIAMPSTGSAAVKRVFTEYAEKYQRVLIIPDLFGLTSLAVRAKDVCGILTLEVDQRIARKLPQFTKRLFDLTACAFVLPLLLPILFVLYLAVLLTSRGPAFYGQSRIGHNGKAFHVWKFRTMVPNADAVLQRHLAVDTELQAEWQRDHKLRNDPRVTPLGRLLRKSSLDELPQLWNVLRGDMSLVGPRPIVTSEITKYGDVFAQYRRVTPGITGLWQISGRNDTTYEDRTRMDDYYVRNWSLSLDLYILLRTFKTLCLSEGAY